ncbi:MAG: HEAT repeat domain-containing protein [Candidatus Micrarchaeota archaeon]
MGYNLGKEKSDITAARPKLDNIRADAFIGKINGHQLFELMLYMLCDNAETRDYAFETTSRIMEIARAMKEERTLDAMGVLAQDIEDSLARHYSRVKSEEKHPWWTGFPEKKIIEILDADKCARCMKALGALGFESSVTVMSEFSKTADTGVKIAVADALRNFRGKRAVETLAGMLCDESGVVRNRALASLERRNDVLLRDVLKPLVNGMLAGKIDAALGEYALKTIAEKSEKGEDFGLGELLKKGWGAVGEIVKYEHMTSEEIRENRIKEKWETIEQMMEKINKARNSAGLEKLSKKHEVRVLRNALSC